MFVALLFLLMQPAFGIYHDLYQHGGSIQHFRRQSNYIPRYPTVYPPFTTTSEPGTTPEKVTISPEDEQKADEIGIRIPPDECIISWDQFKEHVVGRNWLDIYDIDDDDALFPGAITKAHLHWNLVNDTHIRRDASIRIEALNQCLYIWGTEQRVRDGKAVFRPRTGNSLLFPAREDYVVSSYPSKYLLYFFCYEALNQRDGRCPLGIVILLVKDERDWNLGGDGVPEGQLKLNDIPWREIERSMINCFGQKFKDDTHPQVNWVWRGEECAVPRSEVHNAAIMNA